MFGWIVQKYVNEPRLVNRTVNGLGSPIAMPELVSAEPL